MNLDIDVARFFVLENGLVMGGVTIHCTYRR